MSARIAVLVSGGGTNLQAILDACASGALDANVCAVISNRSKAYGLVRADKARVPTRFVSFKAVRKQGGSRQDYDAEVADTVAAFEPDLVVLAGRMHILSGRFLDRFAGRVINLHPALPGAFAGTHAIERAFAAWQAGEIDRSGVMVHHVITEVDAGEPILVAEIPFEPGDTLADFEARVHTTEHRTLVAAIDRVLSNLSESATGAQR